MQVEFSKKGLEEEKELLETGRQEARGEADKLDQRREVIRQSFRYARAVGVFEGGSDLY